MHPSIQNQLHPSIHKESSSSGAGESSSGAGEKCGGGGGGWGGTGAGGEDGCLHRSGLRQHGRDESVGAYDLVGGGLRGGGGGGGGRGASDTMVKSMSALSPSI